MKTKCGIFTWEKLDREGDETWELQRPCEGLTWFAVKNYGGKPGPGFSGWKLVSGGPFDAAGAYSSREEAMRGVIPYLLKYYTRQAQQLQKEAQKQLKFLRQLRLGGRP